MNNDVMARAMNNIDDRLIADAANAEAKKPNLRIIYSISAMAACLLIVFSALFLVLQNSDPVKMYGDRINADTVAVPDPVSFPDAMLRSSESPLTLTLDVNLSEKTEISVTNGTLLFLRKGTDELIHSGTKYSPSESVTLCWAVTNPSETIEYLLTVEDTCTITLKYSTEHSCWTAQKTDLNQ